MSVIEQEGDYMGMKIDVAPKPDSNALLDVAVRVIVALAPNISERDPEPRYAEIDAYDECLGYVTRILQGEDDSREKNMINHEELEDRLNLIKSLTDATPTYEVLRQIKIHVNACLNEFIVEKGLEKTPPEPP